MSDAYEIKDFQQDVIEKSHQIPVLVDFWATWCQPCKMLTPILTEVAKENSERFELAKVDTEKHQQEAVKYGVTSIPSVKLFINGKVEAEFQGALPKKMVLDFIDKNIPTEDKKELEDIKNEIKYGLSPELLSRLEMIAGHSDLLEAKVLLAELIITDQPQKAGSLVHGIMEDSPFFLSANAVKIYSDFIQIQDKDFVEGPIKEKMIKAKAHLLAKEFDLSLEILIDTIITNKAYMNELARRVCVAIFSILGNEHETCRKYRKRFNSSLY